MNAVLAVISVDTYPFLGFSDMTCHLEDMGIGVFWLQYVDHVEKCLFSDSSMVLGLLDQLLISRSCI